MSSRFFTTDALVIGSMRYREADRIVTLYTRDRGRLSAIAKGVRRTKSKVGGRLEPFSLVQDSLHAGRGTLYTVVGVDTVRTFQGVRDELFRMEEGARLLRPSGTCSPGKKPASRPSTFWCAGSPVSPRPKTRRPPPAWCWPPGSSCWCCWATRRRHRTAPAAGAEGPLYGFSPGLGGVICEPCVEAAGVACFALSSGAVATLRCLVENPLADLKDLELDDRATAEVEQVVAQTLAFHGH